nr:TetM/TetW/TetO/TetS family tetracycline resistance ribosomal protection protein [Actinopolymorpha alba]
MNLGILAHVDAGKTSLTERLLFGAGVIDEIGSVDDGSTQTDSLALERQRGITIKSAVVSFVINDVTVNLIDTPGHPDFIAEVERVLSVLDGAVLVISAVEGVQAQTRVLMRTLQRLNIPTLIFVNKIDRGGADDERTLLAIREKLTPVIIPMGSTRELGSKRADFVPYPAGDPAFTASVAEVLADHDEAFLAAYVEGEAGLSYDDVRGELARQGRRARVHPVYFGSAIVGSGVKALISGLTEFLPTSQGDVNGSASGTVFKVERDPAGEKIAYVRMFSGTIRARDRLRFGQERDGKVTAIRVFADGTAVQRRSLQAGHIGRVSGLSDVQIGDTIALPREPSDGQVDWDSETRGERFFAPPTLESVVVPANPADKGALHLALTQLAEQDPLINLRQDDIRQELFVSLYGEVQKEVIQATLANDFGLAVTFRETSMICVERPIGTGAAVELLGKDANPFLATVGLRIEPAPINTGTEFRLDVKHESIPLYRYKAIEEFRKSLEATVKETLHQGVHGWEVIDYVVTLTHSGYMSPETTSGDFRKLAPLVLMSALKEAGTIVCEPMHEFALEFPADTLPAVLAVLARLRAQPQTPDVRGRVGTLEGEIPASQVYALQQQVPGVTRGEGVLETTFHRYQPVRGEFPTRPRTDLNPLNRKEYLRHVLRGV